MNNVDKNAAAHTLGPQLQRARLAKGYSLEDLAIATGLTVAEIQAVEAAGRVTSNAAVERIRHALSI